MWCKDSNPEVKELYIRIDTPWTDQTLIDYHQRTGKNSSDLLIDILELLGKNAQDKMQGLN